MNRWLFFCVLLAGCGGKSAAPVAEVQTAVTPPAAAPVNHVPTEQTPATIPAEPAAPTEPVKPKEPTTEELAAKARTDALANEWKLLTQSEKERANRIDAELSAGKTVTVKMPGGTVIAKGGSAIAPDDFLFALDGPGSPFLFDKLDSAATASCGPLIDSIFLGLPSRGKLALLATWNKSRKEGCTVEESVSSQYFLLSQASAYTSSGADIESDHWMMLPARYDSCGKEMTRLWAIARVLKNRDRVLSDKTIDYARRYDFLHPLIAEYIEKGVSPEAAAALAKGTAKTHMKTPDEFENEQRRSALINAVESIPSLLESVQVAQEQEKRASVIARRGKSKHGAEEAAAAGRRLAFVIDELAEQLGIIKASGAKWEEFATEKSATTIKRAMAKYPHKRKESKP